MHNRQLFLEPGKVVRLLFLVELILLLSNAGAQFCSLVLGHNYVYGIVPLFTFGAEDNFQTFFSLMLLLGAAALLALTGVLETRRGNGRHEWTVLCCGFLVMAFDEVFSFHERLVPPVRALLGEGQLGILYYAWVIPGLLLVAVLGLYFLRFLMTLPQQTTRRFIASAALYLGGAIGFELLGGRQAELYGRDNWAYSMYSTIEESLEMVGVTVFIWALLHHCRQYHQNVTFEFSGLETGSRASPNLAESRISP